MARTTQVSGNQGLMSTNSPPLSSTGTMLPEEVSWIAKNSKASPLPTSPKASVSAKMISKNVLAATTSVRAKAQGWAIGMWSQ